MYVKCRYISKSPTYEAGKTGVKLSPGRTPWNRSADPGVRGNNIGSPRNNALKPSQSMFVHVRYTSSQKSRITRYLTLTHNHPLRKQSHSATILAWHIVFEIHLLCVKHAKYEVRIANYK